MNFSLLVISREHWKGLGGKVCKWNKLLCLKCANELWKLLLPLGFCMVIKYCCWDTQSFLVRNILLLYYKNEFSKKNIVQGNLFHNKNKFERAFSTLKQINVCESLKVYFVRNFIFELFKPTIFSPDIQMWLFFVTHTKLLKDYLLTCYRRFFNCREYDLEQIVFS